MSLTTLANLKAWIEIPAATTTNDVLLQRLIDSSSAFIESWLNRTILQATYSEIYDGNNFDTISLKNYPVQNLNSVLIGGVSQPVLAPGDFVSTGIGFNEYQIYGQYTIFPRGRQNISVTYSAGYVKPPLDIEQACIELSALKYKNMRGERLGMTSKGLAGESTAFFSGDMLPGTKALLYQYRCVVPA